MGCRASSRKVQANTERTGITKGKIICPDDLDEFNDEIAEMFESEDKTNGGAENAD